MSNRATAISAGDNAVAVTESHVNVFNGNVMDVGSAQSVSQVAGAGPHSVEAVAIGNATGSTVITHQASHVSPDGSIAAERTVVLSTDVQDPNLSGVSFLTNYEFTSTSVTKSAVVNTQVQGFSGAAEATADATGPNTDAQTFTNAQVELYNSQVYSASIAISQ